MESDKKISVLTMNLDDGQTNEPRKTGCLEKGLFVGIHLLISCVYACWILVYDLAFFVVNLTISTIMSGFLVQFITTYLLAWVTDGERYRSLLEIEVAVVLLIFIAVEIQPEFERLCYGTTSSVWASRASIITYWIVTLSYVLLTSSCVPLLVLTFKVRFCVDDDASLGSPPIPFEAFMARAPNLLSFCFMISGYFLAKLYVQGKENGINIMTACTGLMCKLVCPIKMTPSKLRLDGMFIEYFAFGMIHEAAAFLVLMVFPTFLIIDIWTSVQAHNDFGVGHSLFGLIMLGFPMTYLASFVDEYTISCLYGRSEFRSTVEKKRLGMVQGGLTCDLLICIACMIGILCDFYSDLRGDICVFRDVPGSEFSSEFTLNMHSQAVQSFIAFTAFLVYAAIKMIIASDWAAEDDESTEDLPYHLVSTLDKPVMDSKPKMAQGILLENGAGALLAEIKVCEDKEPIFPPCGVHV